MSFRFRSTGTNKWQAHSTSTPFPATERNKISIFIQTIFVYFVIYSRFYFDIVLCLFCAVTQQNVARRQHRNTFTMHLYEYHSAVVCGWVFHFVAVILCDILCWPGICRAVRATDRFASTLRAERNEEVTRASAFEWVFRVCVLVALVESKRQTQMSSRYELKL